MQMRMQELEASTTELRHAGESMDRRVLSVEPDLKK
jgi:hypothetical protein